jgi:hypothetical protein
MKEKIGQKPLLAENSPKDSNFTAKINQHDKIILFVRHAFGDVFVGLRR